MNIDKQYLIKKPEDFRELIDDVIALSEDNLVIALEGDLGAGKTTFTQELAQALGVTEVVTSPTFTIMKQYDVTGGKFNKLVHIDAYRIESEEEARPLHLADIFKEKGSIVCVEWPEKISSLIPKEAFKISIKIGLAEERQVSLSKF